MEPDDVASLMRPGHPYTASELAVLLDHYRIGVRRALDTLLEDGRVWKKKHTERSVCYGIPTDCVHGLEGGQVLDMTDVRDAEQAVPADANSDTLSAPSD